MTFAVIYIFSMFNFFRCWTEPSAGSNQGDLFGQSLVDLWDAPVPLPTHNSTSSVDNSPEIDLFADANFVSAPPEPQSVKSPVSQVRFCPSQKD